MTKLMRKMRNSRSEKKCRRTRTRKTVHVAPLPVTWEPSAAADSLCGNVSSAGTAGTSASSQPARANSRDEENDGHHKKSKRRRKRTPSPAAGRLPAHLKPSVPMPLSSDDTHSGADWTRCDGGYTARTAGRADALRAVRTAALKRVAARSPAVTATHVDQPHMAPAAGHLQEPSAAPPGDADQPPMAPAAGHLQEPEHIAAPPSDAEHRLAPAAADLQEPVPIAAPPSDAQQPPLAPAAVDLHELAAASLDAAAGTGGDQAPAALVVDGEQLAAAPPTANNRKVCVI
jgi:hypothetical protein